MTRERIFERWTTTFALIVFALVTSSCADLLDIPGSPRLVGTGPGEGEAQEVGSNERLDDDDGSAGGASGALGAAEPPAGSGSVGSIDGAFAQPPDLLDAGRPSDDAVGADAAAPFGADAASRCAGAEQFGVCWYLGAAGASCNETCATHGGYSQAATQVTGTTSQGGSAEQCSAVLLALGESSPALVAQRADGAGVGCHVFGASRTPYWLFEPSFDPSSGLAVARIACGCVR